MWFCILHVWLTPWPLLLAPLFPCAVYLVCFFFCCWLSSAGGLLCLCGGDFALLILGNVGTALWRLFSTVERFHQYCGGKLSVLLGEPLVGWEGCSALWKVFSTVKDVQYYGVVISVYIGGWPVLWGEHHQNCGGIPSVLWRRFSTTGWYRQYLGRIPSVL